MLTADARQAEIYQKQEEQSTKVSSAAALLAGNGDSGNGGTGSDGDSASIAVGSRNTVASLRGATGDKTAQLRLYRPNPGRATPDRELPEWAVQLPAEDTDSDGASKSQVRMRGNGGRDFFETNELASAVTLSDRRMAADAWI